MTTDNRKAAINLATNLINKIGWSRTGAKNFEELVDAVEQSMVVENGMATIEYTIDGQTHKLIESVK